MQGDGKDKMYICNDLVSVNFQQLLYVKQATHSPHKIHKTGEHGVGRGGHDDREQANDNGRLEP